jgi:hypothetical protein
VFFKKKSRNKRKKEEDEEEKVEETTFVESASPIDISEISKEKKKKKEKKKERKRKQEFWYELDGYPYTVQNFIERDQILRDFQALFSTNSSGLLLITIKPGRYRVFDYDLDIIEKRFYLRTPKQDFSLFNAKKIDSPLNTRKRVVKNYFNRIVFEDGSLARVLVAYRYPQLIPEGFLYSVYGVASEIAIFWETLPMNKAIDIVDRAKRRKASLVSDTKGEKEYYSLVELSRRIAGGSDLMSFNLLFVVYGKDIEELDNKTNTLSDILKTYGVEVHAPYFYQKDLYELKTSFIGDLFTLEKKYTDTLSIRPFFPLISEDLRDEEGIFLGLSGTGNPVEFDIYSRHNYNFVILGVSGAGKSMTAKIYLNRMMQKHKDIVVVGIDPENEYVTDDIRSYLGINTVIVEEGQKLGLDPIKLMKASEGEESVLEIGQVADILADLYAVPQHLHGSLRAELFLNQDRVENMVEFVEKIRDPNLKIYFEGAVAPPDLYVYEGKPPRIDGSVIFGLREVRSRRLKILISAFLSAYAYNRLLRRASKSIFFTDEAWLFMETPSVLQLFENISRRGRKYYLNFLYITQRAEDIASTPQGRTILEQASSALLLRQEKEGIDILTKIYKLSPIEANTLIDSPVGSGLMKAGNKRIMIQVVPTQEEYEVFSTNVVEIQRRVKQTESVVSKQET